MANTLNLFRNGAVGFIDLLDLLGFDLTFCMILEYPSGAAQQEADHYDADERACGRMSDKPRVQLEHDDKHKHGDHCESTTAKDEKRENAGYGSYNNAEHNNNCGDQRRVLKVLLGKKLVTYETTCAGPVIEEVLNPLEHSAK